MCIPNTGVILKKENGCNNVINKNCVNGNNINNNLLNIPRIPAVLGANINIATNRPVSTSKGKVSVGMSNGNINNLNVTNLAPDTLALFKRVGLLNKNESSININTSSKNLLKNVNTQKSKSVLDKNSLSNSNNNGTSNCNRNSNSNGKINNSYNINLGSVMSGGNSNINVTNISSVNKNSMKNDTVNAYRVNKINLPPNADLSFFANVLNNGNVTNVSNVANVNSAGYGPARGIGSGKLYQQNRIITNGGINISNSSNKTNRNTNTGKNSNVFCGLEQNRFKPYVAAVGVNTSKTVTRSTPTVSSHSVIPQSVTRATRMTSVPTPNLNQKSPPLIARQASTGTDVKRKVDNSINNVSNINNGKELNRNSNCNSNNKIGGGSGGSGGSGSSGFDPNKLGVDALCTLLLSELLHNKSKGK